MNARHEAPSTGWDERAQRRAVAAELRKLGAVSSWRHEAGREAAPTTTGRVSTARWPGSGKQGGKAYERNQRFKLLKLLVDPKPGGHGSAQQCTSRKREDSEAGLCKPARRPLGILRRTRGEAAGA